MKHKNIIFTIILYIFIPYIIPYIFFIFDTQSEFKH